MVGRTVTAVLDANVTRYVAAMTKATVATKQFADRSSSAVLKNERHLNNLGRGAGLAGLAVAAGVGVAVKSYADFDSAVSGVASTGADARNNLDALRKAAIKAGADTKFSATQAAQAQEALAKANVSAKDSLGGALTGSLNLAAAGNLSVADSADAAATAMNQFGLKGKDVPHIADLLAAAAGKAQGEVSDMAQALNNVGSVASDFGLSLEETTGSLALFASTGLQGAEAGTNLKSMLLAIAAPSAAAQKEMDRLGIAAYDTQGNFVGLEGLAGQLATQMGDLDDKTRNAALTTIFGNYGIQSATKLYNAGAAGVRKWTAEVDDSGYAADVARIKMDNLKGDLEKLRGSLDTALIQVGKGGDVGLRGLTQGATEAVNAFGELDPSIQSTALGIGALTAGTLLSVAGITRLAVGASDTYTAFRDLSATTPRLASGLRGVATAAGAVGATLIALQVVGAVDRHFKDVFVPAIEESNKALQDLATTGSKTNLDKLFSFDIDGFGNDALVAANGIHGLDEAVARIKYPTGLDGIRQVIDKVTGTTGQMTSINAQFATLDARLGALATGGKTDQAAAAFARLKVEFDKQGVPVEKLIELFPAYAQSVRDAADANGVKLGTTQELADAMSGKLSPAIEKAQEAAKRSAPTYGKSAGALRKMAVESEDAKKALDDLVDSLFDTADAALGLSDAQIGYEQAVDDASQTMKDYKKNLDLGTEGGRKQQEALNRLAGQSHRYIEELVRQGASTKRVEGATKNAREAFIKNAIEMGHSEKGAGKLADAQGLIERDIKIKTSAPGATDAKKQIDAAGKSVKDLPDEKTVTVKYETNAGSVARSFSVGFADRQDILARKTARGGLTGLVAGGMVPGHTPVWKGDDYLWPLRDGRQQPLRGGEGVYVTEAMDDPYEKARLFAVNEAALRGESLAKFQDGLARGGVTSRVHLDVGRFPSAPDFGAVADRLALNIGERIGERIGGALEKRLAAGSAAGVGPIDVNNPRGLTTFRGGRVTNLGAANLRKAEQIAGVVMRVMQGGWRPATSYSGTSHAGDAVDTQPDPALIRGLRAVGWASGDRTGLGNWGSHAHSIPGPGHGFAGGSAVGQWRDYVRRGGASQSLRSPWGLADGGLIHGPGSGTSDNIPIWASNGEFMMNAASTARWLPLLEALNAQGYATGGQISRAQTIDVYQLIRATQSPLYDIAAAVREAGRRNQVASQARSGVLSADRNLDRAQADRTRIGRRVNQLEREANATKGVTAADRDLKKAREDLERADRALEVREDQKTRAIDRSREANDKAADAARRLADTQKALAESARQASESFANAYRSTSIDARDWVELMRTGTTDLSQFTAKLAQLRKAGLSETLVQQIIGMGALTGAATATQIAAGGAGLVRQLNAANTGLQAAADALGYAAGVGRRRFAGGGPVSGPGSGTSDSVLIAASNGEWVVPERAVGPNRPYLEAITYGRQVISHNYARSHYASGGLVNARPLIDREELARIVETIRPIVIEQHFEALNPHAAAAAAADRVAAKLSAQGR